MLQDTAERRQTDNIQTFKDRISFLEFAEFKRKPYLCRCDTSKEGFCFFIPAAVPEGGRLFYSVKIEVSRLWQARRLGNLSSLITLQRYDFFLNYQTNTLFFFYLLRFFCWCVPFGLLDGWNAPAAPAAPAAPGAPTAPTDARGHIPRRNAPHADATGRSEAPGFLLFSGLKCLERRLFFIFLREKMRKTKKADGFRPPALNNSISKYKYASLKY